MSKETEQENYQTLIRNMTIQHNLRVSYDSQYRMESENLKHRLNAERNTFLNTKGT